MPQGLQKARPAEVEKRFVYRYLDIESDDEWKKAEINRILSKGIFSSSSLRRFNDVFECSLRLTFNDKKKFRYVLSKLPPQLKERYSGWVHFFDSGVQKKFVDNDVSLRNIALRKFASLCLSKSRTSPALWGHYARNGRGICVEVERIAWPNLDKDGGDGSIIKINPKRPNEFICDVQYTDRRPTIEAWEMLTSLDDEDDSDLFVQKLFLYKSKVWEHEQEARIVTDSESCTIHLPVTRVLFGPKCSPENKRNLLTRFPDVKFFSTRLSPESFNVVIEKSES